MTEPAIITAGSHQTALDSASKSNRETESGERTVPPTGIGNEMVIL